MSVRFYRKYGQVRLYPGELVFEVSIHAVEITQSIRFPRVDFFIVGTTEEECFAASKRFERRVDFLRAMETGRRMEEEADSRQFYIHPTDLPF